ncbi:universal stress protein [Enterococcus sp. BWB1-3]|uniref:universal stress protein n=1 Tax=unclassified Enterococcus TaxID=2608891 RepID=UPI0019232D2F|nr:MULTISPECIES: universal stress protein [unclassified Enterococcus]MBL1229505.1 universal stress protein [Enterococcus sp. BWB1-3]MCB5955245.1 universal stress protein [Enterococcus sp. CWB-B31]
MEQTYRNILVAVDGSAQAEQAFEKALEIAKRNQAKLHIVYVIEEIGNYFGELTVSVTNAMEVLRKREEEKMQQRADLAHAGGLDNVATYVLYGYPKTLLSDFSESEEPIDLVVIGKTGLNALQRVLVGSTTSYVVNHSNSDVLVVAGKE